MATSSSSNDPRFQAGRAESQYKKLDNDRSPYLKRARDMSKITIPSLVPDQGTTGSTDFTEPNQSIGSRGVNNLASRLLLTLLPPNLPWFKLKLSADLEQVVQSQSQGGNNPAASEIDQTLAQYQQTISDEVEVIGLRPAMWQGLRHLIVAGNVLLHIPNKDPVRYFPLTSYVVRRDPMGSPLEIYINETVDLVTLPEETQNAVLSNLDGSNKSTDQEVDMYTAVVRDTNNWVVWQECKGVEIPGSRGTYKLDDCPWIPLRFTRVDGESYGRGFVEDYQGDLQQVDSLSYALGEGSLAASRVLWVLAPNAMTSAEEVQNAPNNGIITGRTEDIACVQMQKMADFSVARQQIETLRADLGYIFLLNSSVQRNGERVTAEEIRYMAGELETALGGIYSLLTGEFQKPLVTRMMGRLGKSQALPQLPKGALNISIVAGLDALGRNAELDRINTAIGTLNTLFGPGAATQFMNVPAVAAKILTASGVVDPNLVKSIDQLAAEQQANLQNQAVMQSIPHVARAGAQAMAQQAASTGNQNGAQ